MNIQELKDALPNTSAISLGKSKQPNVVALKTRLMDATAWCPEDYSIATRIFIVMNDVVEVPKCVCGEYTVPNKLNNKLGFTEFCTPDCAAKYRRTPKELFNKEWLHEKRVIERMSYQKIGDLLGTSDVVVGKWCRKHGIPQEKFVWYESASADDISNRTESRIKTQIGEGLYEILYKTDTIREMYYNNGLSVSAIADSLNVSENSIKTAASFIGLVLEERTYYIHKSIGETSLGEFISSMVECEFNYRPDGYGTPELDIYIPSKKIGIEYNGCYFHSDKFKDKKYHQQKTEYFSNLGIRVIHVWSDDWDINRKRTEMFLSNIFNQRKGMGARHFTVSELSQYEYSTFLNKHHMQGSNFPGVRLGLIMNGVVHAVMGFKSIPKNVSKVGWDLTRFANTNVIGGFTKLLSHFRKNYSGKIYSFADLSIVDSKNNVYSKNGFVEISRQSPDYRYFNTKTKIRHHKFNYRRKTFENLGIDITGKEERQLADEYGLLRCYDSGKICYMLQ